MKLPVSVIDEATAGAEEGKTRIGVTSSLNGTVQSDQVVVLVLTDSCYVMLAIIAHVHHPSGITHSNGTWECC
jgi:hypothetical protein